MSGITFQVQQMKSARTMRRLDARLCEVLREKFPNLMLHWVDDSLCLSHPIPAVAERAYAFLVREMPGMMEHAMRLDGYEEAKRLDSAIYELLDEFPITETTAQAWANLTRTVQTTCGMIHSAAIQKLADTRRADDGAAESTDC